jgi:hypothetical protein
VETTPRKLMHDPVRALYDELERADCDPHGPEHHFRARCPAHDGENREALSVREGPAGIALVKCFHGCSASEVMEALGHPVAWLFSDYEPKPVTGQRWRPPKRVSAIDATVGMFRLAGVLIDVARPAGGYAPGMPVFRVAEFCPACGAPGLWVYPLSSRRVAMGCWSGCEQDRIRAAARDRALSRG